MKNKVLVLVSLFFLIACGSSNDEKKADNKVLSFSNFDEMKSEFIEDLWKLNPIWASYEGYHKYDDQLPIPNAERRKAQLDFASKWDQQLQTVDEGSLANNDRIDYRLMEDYIEEIAFNINEYRSYEWNPASYNLGGTFFQVLNYRQSSLEERMNALNSKLDHVPAYYAAAKENIDRPTKIHTELAIAQLKGSIGVFEGNLIDSLVKSKVDVAIKESITKKVEVAVVSINDYIEFLEELYETLDSTNSRSFRIGKELFEKKFAYDIQSSFTAEEIFEIAVEEKSILHENMARVADLLWEDYFPGQERPGRNLDLIRMVIDEASKDHVHRDSFITAIRQQIPQLEEFIRQNDLLDLDPDKPLVVRETPKYMQGFAGASISAPGPYDKDAETYYNVTPLDHYSEEEAESYLREYNTYVLQILNIHEAIPGHYTQLVYANESPSLIKNILGNGAMIEGWAVYTEKMMLEAGYGGDQMEMGLMYYKWNLRTVCNTILDYGVHINNFTEEDAMQLLMKEAFQEQAEATGKWRRARLSQVQLCSYFTGYHEIRQLRDKIMELDGDQFSLKEFHKEFLSYGSAPVKYIAELMLEAREGKMGS